MQTNVTEVLYCVTLYQPYLSCFNYRMNNNSFNHILVLCLLLFHVWIIVTILLFYVRNCHFRGSHASFSSNKETTGTIFITSLVWHGPWLGIEPGTSRTRYQHSTTRLSRRRWKRKVFLGVVKTLSFVVWMCKQPLHQSEFLTSITSSITWLLQYWDTVWYRTLALTD